MYCLTHIVQNGQCTSIILMRVNCNFRHDLSMSTCAYKMRWTCICEFHQMSQCVTLHKYNPINFPYHLSQIKTVCPYQCANQWSIVNKQLLCKLFLDYCGNMHGNIIPAISHCSLCDKDTCSLPSGTTMLSDST